MISNDDFEDEMPEEGSKKSDEFARMLEESFSKKPKKFTIGDKIRGEILVIGQEEVFVAVGPSRDGHASKRELLDKEGQFKHKVGDVLELFVVNVRGTDIMLSPKPTSKNLADGLQDAFEMRLPVEGRISELCKGGVRVLVMNKSSFCPISQIDTKRIDTADEYIGKKFEFLITQLSEGGRNIVVSRRRLLEQTKGVTEGSFMEENKEGAILPGKITRIEKFGAFVEIAPAIEGLAHVSELAWSRVGDPHEVVQVGQEVIVKILKYDNVDGRMKISLSLKQAGAEPWQSIAAEIQEGQVVTGKVTKCMKFGAFVEIAPGIEGLVPMSEMSYTQRVNRSDELFKEGDKISVLIKSVDTATRRISLSLKDAGEGDPWSQVVAKFPVGKVVKGKVTRREGYGLFVQLEDGIVGLLPKSKALEIPEYPFDKLKINDETTVQIGEVRVGERRISLQPPGDPSTTDWKDYTQTTGSLGTLGDQFKNFFAQKTPVDAEAEKKTRK